MISLFIVGGADPSNILNFKSHYPGAQEIRLEQNYRSSGNIVNAASSMIRNNKVRAQSTLDRKP